MASQWLRAATTAAILYASAGALLPGHAQAAASKTASCKTSTTTPTAPAACPAKPQAQPAKKPAAKVTTTSATTVSAAKVKPASVKPINARTASAKPASVKTSLKKTQTPAKARKPADPEALLKSISASGPKGDVASLRSTTAYVQDVSTSSVLFAKNENVVRPIASISKLMTAIVIVDANQPMDETLEISEDDVDMLRHSGSRLPVGTRLSRGDMLHLALMSSENRAAHALGRYYPGGMPAFVAAMNAKARELGMSDTHFIEPTGLSSENVSSPHDLARMVIAA
jgi:D-alanyl-D-alanine endopeptidase (penicillin-binding protein 7)